MGETVWYLYLIRTVSGSLYTGITTDVERRFGEHQAGKGAKYLRGKSPLTLVFSQKVGDQSSALKIEMTVKKWSKTKKERWVRGLLESSEILPPSL